MHDYSIKGGSVKWLAFGITVFAAVSMVSTVPFYSGKEINLRKSVPFMMLLLLLLFFVLIPIHPPIALFALFVIYALSGYVMWLWRMGKGKQDSGMPKA